MHEGSIPSVSTPKKIILKKRYYKKRIPRGPLANLNIKAKQVRVIDIGGQQLGIMSLQDALRKTKERNLDLVQVTEKVDPPVCKIIDFGKYLYRQKKKDKIPKTKSGELKNVRLSFNISDHDLETRTKQAEKFLNKGYKVRIEMKLRGRQKGLLDFAKTKVEKFLKQLGGKTPFKTERELTKQPRGLTMIITK